MSDFDTALDQVAPPPAAPQQPPTPTSPAAGEPAVPAGTGLLPSPVPALPVQKEPSFDQLLDATTQESNADKQARATELNAHFNLLEGKGKNPDEAGRAEELSKILGLPVDTIERNQNWAEAQVEAQIAKMELRDPKIAKFYDDQATARIAHDKVSAMSWWQRQLYAAETGLRQGWESTEQTDLEMKSRDGNLTGPERERLDQLNADIETPNEQLGLKDWSLEAGVRQTTSMATTIGRQVALSMNTMMQGAVAGGTAGAIAGTVGGGVTAAPMAAGGFVAGAGIGMSMGMFDQGYRMGTAGLHRTFEQMTDSNGARLNPTVQWWAEEVAGIVSGALNIATFGAAAKPASGAAEAVATAVMSRLAEKPSMAIALKRAALSTGKGVTIGGGIGAAQAVTNTAAETLAADLTNMIEKTKFTTVWNDPEKRQQAIEQIVDSTLTMAATIGAFHAAGAPVTMAAEALKIRRAGQDARLYDAIVNGDQAVGLSKRPGGRDAVQRWLGLNLDGTESENVYIPATKLVELFQSAARDAGVTVTEGEKATPGRGPADPLTQLVPNLGEQIERSLPTNGDVVIPAKAFFSRLVGTPLLERLKGDMRLREDGLSLNEAKQAAQRHEEFTKAQQAHWEAQLEAGIAEPDAGTRVYEHMRDTLEIKNGFTKGAAAHHAALVAQHYTQRAERSPHLFGDAWEAYRAGPFGGGFEVQSPVPERLRARSPDQLDLLVNSLRSGKETPAAAAPQGLTDFLAKSGAVTPADRARLAHEAGYFPEHSEPPGADVLKAALAEETAGRPRFSERAAKEAVTVTQFGEDRAALADTLASMGVDIKTATNDQVRAALAEAIQKEDTHGRTLEQSVSLRTRRETLKKYGLDPEGKYNTREVAEALEKRQRDKYGMIAPDDRSSEASRRISKWMAAEILHEMLTPEKSGVGWYSQKFQRALDAFSTAFPELKTSQDARDTMTALIAITSDGAKVMDNFGHAANIYRNFRDTGKFEATRGTARQASVDTNLRNINDLYARLGPRGMRDFLMQEASVSDLKKLAKQKGLKFETDYQAHIKMPMAAVVFGPKLGAFYANLMGASGYLTMDRWWSRTFNRYRGTLLQAPTKAGLERFKGLLGKPRMSDDAALRATEAYRDSYAAKKYKNGTEIEKAANTLYKAAFEGLEDQPFNATDRTFMLDTVNRAQKELAKQGVEMSVADMQAVLWYYEKRLYGDLGARKTPDISYEETANLIAGQIAAPERGAGGERSFAQGARERAGRGPDTGVPTGQEEFGPTAETPGDGAGRLLGRSAPQVDSPEFKGWFGDSKVVDESGKPLIVYRGEHGAGPAGDFHTQSPSLSFGSQNAANIYAMSPNDRTMGAAQVPRVTPVYLKIENPIIHETTGDPFVDFDDLITKLGRDTVHQLALKHADYIENTNNWHETINPHGEYLGVEDFLKRHPERMKELYMDAYPLLDDPAFVKAAKAAGYDGAIHGSNGDTALETEYRIFDPSQAKSAVGNRGTFDRADPRILNQAVYHGSPYRFDKFTLDHIGQGEGAQAYGWGLYFAGNKEVARYYRDALSPGEYVELHGERLEDQHGYLAAMLRNMAYYMSSKKGKSFDEAKATALGDLKYRVGFEDKKGTAEAAREAQAAHDTIKDLSQSEFALKSEGRLYKVEIPEDDQFLHWDRDFKDQPPEVQKKLVAAMSEIMGRPWSFDPNRSGRAIYFDVMLGLKPKGTDGQERASKALRAAGIPGLMYQDAGSRGGPSGLSRSQIEARIEALKTDIAAGGGDQVKMKRQLTSLEGELEKAKEPTHNYVLFDDAAAQITSYEQPKRGSITFGDGRAVINLFQGRDLSTLIHELGHMWLEEIGQDVRDPRAPEQLRKDHQTILDFLGSTDGFITTEQHEKFARAFETYAMEGKAPSAELAGAFRSFKNWLTQIYKKLTNLDAPISPEMRDVFDRMVATDDQIKAAQDHQGLNPIFKDAASAGMTEEQFAAYTKNATEVVDQAEQRMLAKVMEGIRRQRTQEWKDAEKNTRALVTREAMEDPGQQVVHLLRTGKTYEGETPEPLRGVKLTKQSIIDAYGSEEALRMMPPGSYLDRVAGPGAIDAGELAEVLGFASGKEMLDAVQKLEAQRQLQMERGDKRSVLKAKVDEETAQRMKDSHGDTMDASSIEAEAMAAVHGDKQAALMGVELRALARRAGHTGTIDLRQIANWATESVGNMSVREGAKFSRYAMAERKAGEAVEKALLKGDFLGAFRAKQDQIVNNRLWVEAKKASNDIDKGRERMDRYASARTIKSMEQSYLEQIHGLLEDYDFKTRSAAEINTVLRFEVWAANQAADGVDHLGDALSDRMKSQIGRLNYKDLTVDEFRGLSETVDQVAKLGRLFKTLTVDQEKRDFRATVDSMVAQLEGLSKQIGQPDERNPTVAGKGFREQKRAWLKSLEEARRSGAASLTKMEQLFDWADGRFGVAGKGIGLFNRILFKPMADRQGWENDKLTVFAKKLKEIADAVPKETSKGWLDRLDIPSLKSVDPERSQGAFLKSDIVAMALNWGNEGNRSKMLEGDGWKEDDVKAALDKHMTKADWDYVQKQWDLINELWPEAAALEREVNGVEAPKVEAVSFDTPHGTYAGGYFPAVYDQRLSRRARAQAASKQGQIFPTNYTRATTSQGHHKARTGYSAPILLDLGVTPKHITEVIHDLAFRQVLRQADKIFRDKAFADAFTNAFGSEFYDQLNPWLQGMAGDTSYDKDGLGFWSARVKQARLNTSIVGMGLRGTTMIQQVTGNLDTAAYLGTKWTAIGNASFYANPFAMGERKRFVFESSAEMRHRMDSLERDVRDGLRSLLGQKGPITSVKRFAYYGIGVFDMAVSIPAWLGGYKKALSEGLSHEDAVYEGDKAVRLSQGGGAAKDMAAVQRPDSEAMKLFTMFYSWANHFYNQTSDIMRQTGASAREGHLVRDFPMIAARSFFLFLGPALAGPLLTGQGPEDDETWGGWTLRNVGFGLLTGIPMARDVANTAARQMGGKGSDYMPTPVGKAVNTVVFKTLPDIGHMLGWEGDASDKWIQHALESAGYIFGLPLGQPGAEAQFLWDLHTGTQNPQSIGEWYRALLTGRSK